MIITIITIIINNPSVLLWYQNPDQSIKNTLTMLINNRLIEKNNNKVTKQRLIQSCQ